MKKIFLLMIFVLFAIIGAVSGHFYGYYPGYYGRGGFYRYGYGGYRRGWGINRWGRVRGVYYG